MMAAAKSVNTAPLPSYLLHVCVCAIVLPCYLLRVCVTTLPPLPRYLLRVCV